MKNNTLLFGSLCSNSLPSAAHKNSCAEKTTVNAKSIHKRWLLMPLMVLGFLFTNGDLWGQNSLNSGDFSGGSWGSGQAMSASAGGSLIITKGVASSGDKFFRFFGDGSPCGEYQPNSNGDLFTHKTSVTSPNGNCGNSNAWKINVPTASSNVVFKTDGGNDGIERSVAFVIQGAVRSVSSQDRNIPTPTASQSPTITATLSGALFTGQSVYLRYTTNSFTSSTIVQMTGSGTSYTASIPKQAAGTTVTYYLFTSGDDMTIVHADADFFTINLTSSSSYTVPTSSRFAVASGDWNATSTWSATSGGASGATVPGAGDNVTIEGGHTVTVTANAAAGSITFTGISGTLSVNNGLTLTISGNVSLNHNNSNTAEAYLSGTGTISIVGDLRVGPNDPGASLQNNRYTRISTDVLQLNVTGNISVSANRYDNSRLRQGYFDINGGTVTVDGTINPIFPAFASDVYFRMTGGGSTQKTLVLNNTSPWGTSSNINCPWNNTSSRGTYTISLTGSNATVVYNRIGDQTINRSGNSSCASSIITINYTNLTLAGSGIKTLPVRSAASVSGTLSIEGAATFTNSGTFTYGASSTLQYKNAGNRTTTALEWPSSTGPRNLIIDNSGSTITMLSGNARTLTQNLTLTAGTLADNGNTLTVNGNIAGTGTHSGAGKILLNTTGSTISGATLGNLELNSASGSYSLTGNPTINGTLTLANGTLTVGASGIVTIGSGGAISRSSGALVAGTGAGTFTFSGTGTVTGTVGFNNVNIAGGVNFGAASTINGILSINSGGFVNISPPTYAIGSTLIYNTTGTYGRGLEWSATSGPGFPHHVQIQNGTTVDISTNGFADRAIAGDLRLGLEGASAGSLTMGATTNKLSIAGNIVIGGNTSGTSVLTLSSAIGGDIYLRGNWETKTNGSYVANTRAVFFEANGTSLVKTIGAATFDFLFVNKTGDGVVSLENDMTVNNNLTLNAQLVTNAFKVIIPSSSGVTANANGWVRGFLQKNIPTGSNSRTFEIGDANAYTPVITDYSGVTGAGNIVVKTTSVDHPQIATSNIDANRSVNRNYSITNIGVTGGSYDATFTFVAGDVDSGADTSLFGVGNYINPTWSAATLGTRTSTTTKATGITTYGDFQLGETKTMWTGGASTTDWATAGNWSFGVPTSSTNTYIGSAGVYPEISSDVTINSLTINSGTTLKVNSNYDLTVTDVITNNGTLTIENSGNLLQTNNVANTGSGSTIVKRNSNPLIRLDYTLWSSPVSGQGLYAFSPFTSVVPNIRFYKYNPIITSPATTGVYSNDLGFTLSGLDGNNVNGTDTSNIPFATGKGYLIRLPWNHPTAAVIWNGQFTGVPNNGTQNVSIINQGDRYNAVGNPYPSPISISQFASDNSNNIESTLYFWRKTNNTSSPSYCTWNTATSTYGDNGQAYTETPAGVIQTGQGFFVRAKVGATTLAFNNGQRIGNNANQFFRAPENSLTTIEANRIWLNMTGATAGFSQSVVGYFSNSALGLDDTDSRFFNDGPISLTTTIAGEDYVIQGRPLPFDATDVVPMKYKVTTAGNYTIAIDHVDGLFTSGQEIFLRDNLNAVVHSLTAGAYTFSSDAGTFNNRFEVVYQSQLAVDDQIFNSNQVIIYKNEINDFVINSGNVIMANVKVFDVRGRLLQEHRNVNASQTTISVGLANEMLLIQITSQDDVTVVKKVVR
jgi:hypothetical protein